VRPLYPPALRDAGIQGVVLMDGRIGTDGFIRDLRLVTPVHPDLERAAFDAVRAWQFEPTRLHGVPVETRIDVTVRFALQP
jgi:TonB family protein